MSEALLIVVGVGTVAFMLAMSRIVSAETSRALDMHRVQVRAMQLRNAYAQSILALHADGAPDEVIIATPVDELDGAAGDGARRAA